MILRIDTTNSMPVYAQIVDQIKHAIVSAALKPGDCLPSLRETAMKLRVNPLTVSKAYKQLEQEKLIETRHGLGSFVTSTAEDSAQDYCHEALCRTIDSLLVDACHMGVGFEEVKRLVDERIESAMNGFAKEYLDGRTNDERQQAVCNRDEQSDQTLQKTTRGRQPFNQGPDR